MSLGQMELKQKVPKILTKPESSNISARMSLVREVDVKRSGTSKEPKKSIMNIKPNLAGINLNKLWRVS